MFYSNPSLKWCEEIRALKIDCFNLFSHYRFPVHLQFSLYLFVLTSHSVENAKIYSQDILQKVCVHSKYAVWCFHEIFFEVRVKF